MQQENKELFTRGQWYIERKCAGVDVWSNIPTQGHERQIVATVYGLDQEANAALIEQAPAMYKALKKAIEWIEDLGGKDGAGQLSEMKSILNKANPKP